MLKIELPAILHLGIYPREGKTCPHRNLYTNVHSIITHNSQNWKQPKCPSASEWINKMWFIHTVEYYTVVKRKEVLTWMCNRENKPDSILDLFLCALLPVLSHAGSASFVKACCL